jgi:flagellar assembly factor FliW
VRHLIVQALTQNWVSILVTNPFYIFEQYLLPSSVIELISLTTGVVGDPLSDLKVHAILVKIGDLGSTERTVGVNRRKTSLR